MTTLVPRRTATCSLCNEKIVGPRLVLNEKWACTTCVYYLEMGWTPPSKDGA